LDGSPDLWNNDFTANQGSLYLRWAINRFDNNPVFNHLLSAGVRFGEGNFFSAP